MNKHEAFELVYSSLEKEFGRGEARAIARRYVEDIFISDFGKMTQVFNLESVKADIERLIGGIPIQYVTGCELFNGRYFKVTPDVSLPSQLFW